MLQPPVRAFLSHSSADKPYVEEVFNDLGQTLAELDTVTFEPAKLNSEVILRALDRCAIFVLFASKASLQSNWVALEIKEALARLKDRRLSRILVYCSDRNAFQLLDPELKDFNIVRVEKAPRICARQIRGSLAEIFADRFRVDTFISRDENLAELKRLVIDPSKDIRTLAISGFDRLGRRTLAKKFCQDVYGSFSLPTTSIVVDVSTSLDDIFRQLLTLQYNNLERTELIDRLTSFSKLNEPDQIKLVGEEIKAIYSQREFVQFVDVGGLLGDDGDLTKMFGGILAATPELTDLVHILILYRNAPDWVKRKHQSIAFYRLAPLTNAQADIALAHELKKRKTTLAADQITRLIDIIDGHPANLDYIVGYIFREDKLDPLRLTEVIDGSTEFTNWKRSRASAYVGRFEFSDIETLLIGLLSRYRGLGAESLARFMHERDISTEMLGKALGKLFDLNIVDVNGSEYRLIRPLRDSLERDKRFQLTPRQSDDFARSLVETLKSYEAGDSVPISLIDSATIASIRDDKIAPGWIQQLILPSHYIWIARDSYHKSDYPSALEFSRRALELRAVMTSEARLEALRFAGLSCARIGTQPELESITQQIDALGSKRARAIKHFVIGFSSRLKGQLQTAYDELKKSFELLPGSIDVERELLGVMLARREFDEALQLARNLVQRAESNPYVLDGYLQARIATASNVDALLYDGEFTRRLDQLEEVGDGPGYSFFALRKTDIAIKQRNKPESLEYSGRALANTPALPAAHAARARALILDGNYDGAFEQLKALEQVRPRAARDGLEQLVLHQVRFEYNLERDRFDLCKSDVENTARFDENQAKAMKMAMIHKISNGGYKLGDNLREWLKK